MARLGYPPWSQFLRLHLDDGAREIGQLHPESDVSRGFDELGGRADRCRDLHGTEIGRVVSTAGDGHYPAKKDVRCAGYPSIPFTRHHVFQVVIPIAVAA